MSNRKATPELLDATPPHSLEAERAVLGSVLLDHRICDDVAAILNEPEAFYVHSHQVLYGHLLAMNSAGAKTDMTLLVERLRQHGDFEDVGGAVFLAELAQSVPTAANARYYATIVRNYALRRATIYAAVDILRDAHEGSADGATLIASVHARAEQLSECAASDSVLSASQSVDAARERIQALLGERGEPSVDTGLTDVDKAIGGMFAGELVVLAARTSVGKTALALQIAARHAAQGSRVLFFSSEMKAGELMLRNLCTHAGVSVSWLRNRSIRESELAKIDEAAAAFRQVPLFVDENKKPSAADIRHAARRHHRQSPLALVVIDHLQRLRVADERRPLNEQIGKLAAESKDLALELGIPVLLLSQVNRESDKALDHRPRLSNLSQSGGTETDADQVWILHRPELYKRDPDLRGLAELNVAKNRNGSTGEFRLTWDASLTLFKDAALTTSQATNLPALTELTPSRSS